MTIEEIKDVIEKRLRSEPSPPRYRLSQLKECLRQQWFEVNKPMPETAVEPSLIELGHYLKPVVHTIPQKTKAFSLQL